MIKKILFFTLSNFGDVILTLPVLDVLRVNYPDSKITVMVGPRAAEVFGNNPYIHNLIIYDKYAPLRKKMQLFFQLKKGRYDLVIDLRNTLFGALLPVRFRTSPFLRIPPHIRHMRQKNLYRLMAALRHREPSMPTKERLFYISPEDENYIDSLFQEHGIAKSDKIIIISPAAGGKTRRWQKEKFVGLCFSLVNNYSVILIGRENDKPLTQYIKSECKDLLETKTSNKTGKIFDFAGITNLAQLGALFKKSYLVVVCDTGILHLASYLDIPIVGLFGPSDERRYGPWSTKFKVIFSPIPCRPCRKPDCKFNTVECMQKISVNEVLDSIDALLKS